MSRGSRRQRVTNAYDISAPQHLDSATKMGSEATGTEGITLPPMSMHGGDQSNPDILPNTSMGMGLNQDYNSKNFPSRKGSQ